MTENEFCVGGRRHFKFQSSDVDVTAECPEVRLLYAVDALQLRYLHSPHTLQFT